MHTKHLAQLSFLITYTPHSQKYMTFLAKTCLGAEPMIQFYLIPVRPQVVRIHFRCIKSESGIKGHAGKGSGSEQTHLSSKPHLEERCYYFLFLHVKKDQISDTLLLDQYILLKKKKKSFCNSPSPHPYPQPQWPQFLTRERRLGGITRERADWRKVHAGSPSRATKERVSFCLGELEGENWLQFYNWKQEKE